MFIARILYIKGQSPFDLGKKNTISILKEI